MPCVFPILSLKALNLARAGETEATARREALAYAAGVIATCLALGAILLILRSKGYTLMWPPEAGIRPYQTGHANQVVKVEWREGSVFSPPSGWFHQHFNTGNEKARQLAFRYSGQSGKYLLGAWRAINKEGVRTSVREGGTMIEYEDEDPQIRADFETAINRVGVPMEMPQFAYAEL